MINWQITAKTIFCDAVDDEVTVLVYKDGSTRCTGWKKYCEPNGITRGIIKEKNKRLRRAIKCEGEQCLHLSQYKDKIVAEEGE